MSDFNYDPTSPSYDGNNSLQSSKKDLDEVYEPTSPSYRGNDERYHFNTEVYDSTSPSYEGSEDRYLLNTEVYDPTSPSYKGSGSECTRSPNIKKKTNFGNKPKIFKNNGVYDPTLPSYNKEIHGPTSPYVKNLPISQEIKRNIFREIN